MLSQSLSRLTVAGALLAAVPMAWAQSHEQLASRPPTELVTNGPQASTGDYSREWPAQRNVIESQRYEQLLRTNPTFRAARIRKECGPINDPHLHAGCVASFSPG
jgi:hypothetical protein